MHATTQQPWEYEFYQLVRLLELDSFRQQRMTQSDDLDSLADATKIAAAMRLFPVGEGASPKQEPVRFKINPSMTFAPAVVKSLEVAKEREVQRRGPKSRWDIPIMLRTNGKWQ